MSDELDDLFAEIRAREAPSGARRDAIWAAIGRRIGEGDLGPRIGPVPPPVQRSSGGFALVWAAVAVIGIGGGWMMLADRVQLSARVGGSDGVQANDLEATGGVSARATVRDDEGIEPLRHRGGARPRALDVETPEPAPLELVPPRVPPEPAPLELGPPPAAASVPAPAATPAPRRVRRSAPTIVETPAIETPARAPAIAAEVAALSSARRSLARGDAEAALAALAALGDGDDLALAPERAALEVAALCAAGRTDDARDASRRFASRFVDSPLRGKVAAICRG